MFYFWLVPILVLALVALALFSSSARRKAGRVEPPSREQPDPIKRGEHLND